LGCPDGFLAVDALAVDVAVVAIFVSLSLRLLNFLVRYIVVVDFA
jgi:hypothetical protein